jgi:hypothetical protein
MAHTDLTKVKSYLGITSTDFDTILGELITQVTAFVEGMMGGRIIEKATYTEEKHDGGERDIFVFNFPIDEVAGITAEFRGGSLSSPTWTAFTLDDFIIYPDSGFVHFLAHTPWGSRNLRITYDGGYDTVPEDLVLLSNQLVAFIFNKRTSQGIKKESVEGSSVEYFGGGEAGALSVTILTQEQKDVIGRYCSHSVGQSL